MNAIRATLRRMSNWLCPPMPEEVQTYENVSGMPRLDQLHQPLLPGVMDMYWYRV